MADQILYARVKQKKATEAVWLANPLILLDGEVAYVVDPTDPAVVTNYKIGVGDKTFAQLPYVIHYAADATYQTVKRFIAVTTDQVITGVFKAGTTLNKIPFLNSGAVPLTIRIGTTSGGAEIAQFNFSEPGKVLDLNYLFESTKTVYISGISGNLCTFYVDYTPYSDSPVTLPAPEVPTVFRYPKHHFGYFYEFNDGDLEANFDTSTGLGIAGMPFENCALTGTNSLVDYSNAYVVGVNSGGTSQGLTGNTDNTQTLISANLPPITLTLGKDRKGGNSGTDVLSALTPGPFGSNDYSLGGSSAAFNIQPRSIKMYSFVAISD